MFSFYDNIQRRFRIQQLQGVGKVYTLIFIYKELT